MTNSKPEPSDYETTTVSQELMKRVGTKSFSNVGPISTGGGGGDDDLRTRVAVMEAYLGSIKEDITAIKPDVKDARERLIRLEEKVVQLPSKGYILTASLLIIAAIGAFTTLQGQIQALFGTSPSVPN